MPVDLWAGGRNYCEIPSAVRGLAIIDVDVVQICPLRNASAIESHCLAVRSGSNCYDSLMWKPRSVVGTQRILDFQVVGSANTH